MAVRLADEVFRRESDAQIAIGSVAAIVMAPLASVPTDNRHPPRV
jgi:hypothetical protein